MPNLWLWALVIKACLLNRLSGFEKLVIGFSGGMDSTLLLHLIAAEPSLQNKILAVHINHGISPNAASWQKHCEQICQQLSVRFMVQKVEFNRQANIEDNARRARHQVFAEVLTESDALLLGHHQDDQAETLLLQLFRGAGIAGLAAMQEEGLFGKSHCFRPFISFSKQELAFHAQQLKLSWIHDESNDDIHYSRNYLRREVMPLLMDRWPGVINNVARAAKHCQIAKNNLDSLAILDYKEFDLNQSSINISSLKQLSDDRLVNVLRAWLKRNDVKSPSAVIFKRILDELVHAGIDAQPLISWGVIALRRYQGYIYLDKIKQKKSLSHLVWHNFPSQLQWEEHSFISAFNCNEGVMIPQQAKIEIRTRQGGEYFAWHGQKKHLKKLFQEWKIPPWQRDEIPLLYINDELAVVVGYAISDHYYSKDEKAWCLDLRTV